MYHWSGSQLTKSIDKLNQNIFSKLGQKSWKLMLCESCHMDKGIRFPPCPVLQHCFLLQKYSVILSGYSTVKPSIVIIISMAVFKEYEKCLVIDRLFFMEGWWGEVRLQLHWKPSLCQTPSSSIPWPRQVVLLRSQAQNMVTCPVHPAVIQSGVFFPFLPSTLQLSFVPEVKTKEGEQESLQWESHTLQSEQFVSISWVSPTLSCSFLIHLSDDRVTFKWLPCTAGIDFSIVTLVPCPRHIDLISWKWFLPFKFFLGDVGCQFIFLPLL